MAKEQKKDKSYLIAVMLLLLSGFFVLLFLLPDGKKRSDQGGNSDLVHSKEFEDRVNKHLFKTSQDIEISREKMQIEANDLERQGLGKPMSKDEVHKLDFSADPRAEALLRELGRDVKESTGPTNADEQVQTDLFEAQQGQEYSEAYKREYARQFMENARKAGYIIKLSDDYKVMSVKPLRKPADSYDLFKSQGTGAH